MDRSSDGKISSDKEFEKSKYWGFERATHLPYGYFEEGWSWRDALHRLVARLIHWRSP